MDKKELYFSIMKNEGCINLPEVWVNTDRSLVLCASVIYIKQLSLLLKTVVNAAETLPALQLCELWGTNHSVSWRKYGMHFLLLGSAFFRIIFIFPNASHVEDDTTTKASWFFSLSESTLSRFMFELNFMLTVESFSIPNNIFSDRVTRVCLCIHT